MKFRRKLEEIEAEEYRVGLEDGFSCIPHTCECLRKDENGKYKQCHTCTLDVKKSPFIEDSDGRFYISDGDWIITFEDGVKHICSKQAFELLYEPTICSKEMPEEPATVTPSGTSDLYCAGCGKPKVLCLGGTTGCNK